MDAEDILDALNATFMGVISHQERRLLWRIMLRYMQKKNLSNVISRGVAMQQEHRVK